MNVHKKGTFFYLAENQLNNLFLQVFCNFPLSILCIVCTNFRGKPEETSRKKYIFFNYFSQNLVGRRPFWKPAMINTGMHLYLKIS